MILKNINSSKINYEAFAITFTLLCSLSTLSLAASDQTTKKSNHPSAISITKHVKAGMVEEDCLLVKKGEVITYQFTSSSPLNFNFHYHDKTKREIIYIVDPKEVTGDFAENAYQAGKTQLMCLMWKNKGTIESKLRYTHWLTKI